MLNCQPPSASGSPRFCNMGNFMRLPRAESAEGLDFAVVGIPFDTAASFRPGARFGPNGVRNISAMIKPNTINLERINYYGLFCCTRSVGSYCRSGIEDNRQMRRKRTDS